MAILYHALFQDPTWSAAIATWLLFFVTALAAGFGVPVAIAAAKTFRLESDPVILVRKALFEASSTLDLTLVSAASEVTAAFVVDGMPLVADGIELRSARPRDASHPNARVARTTSLIVHNAGRSPAVAITIPISVTTPVHVDLMHVDPEELSDVRDVVGFGQIEVHGIEAGASVIVEVKNLLGNAVVLKVAELGTCLRIEGTKRTPKTVPIVALDEIILPGP